MEEQSDTPRTDAAKDQMVRVPMKFINKIERERDEARAEVERLRAELFFVLRGDGLEHLYDGDCPASNALHARDPECPACKRLNELAATEARPATPDGLPTYDKEKALEWVAQLRDGNKEAKP